MRITCPNCQARYEVPESLLASGRPVRCARCGEEWVPETADRPSGEDQAGGAPPPKRRTETRALPPPPAQVPDHSPKPAPERVPKPFPGPGPMPPAGPGQRPSPGGPLPTLFPPPAADRGGARFSPAGRDSWPQRRDKSGWPVPPPSEMPSRTGLAVAWVASLIAVAVLVWAAYAFRDNVIAVWPASARVYSGLGIETVQPPRR